MGSQVRYAEDSNTCIIVMMILWKNTSNKWIDAPRIFVHFGFPPFDMCTNGFCELTGSDERINSISIDPVKPVSFGKLLISKRVGSMFRTRILNPFTFLLPLNRYRIRKLHSFNIVPTHQNKSGDCAFILLASIERKTCRGKISDSNIFLLVAVNHLCFIHT